MNRPWMPFLSRCTICGSRSDLKRCPICRKRTCQLHLVSGKCLRCMEREVLFNQRSELITFEKARTAPESSDLITEVKLRTDVQSMLGDLYLLLGGRPGGNRSTTPFGSLHLDHRKRSLMYDHQVAKLIYVTSFVVVNQPGFADIVTRTHPPSLSRAGCATVSEAWDYRYANARIAHDQLVRMVDLVYRTLGPEPVQIVGGMGPLDQIGLDAQMSCPTCGNWLEVCQCARKPARTMPASEYFKTSVGSRLMQRRRALEMAPSNRTRELEDRISAWQRALAIYR